MLHFIYIYSSEIFMLMYIILLLNICLYRHNILKFLMSLELVLIIILVDFSLTSYYFDDSFGLIIALFLFLLAGSETALGLAIVVSLHRNINRVDIEYFTELCG